ncbi:MAG: hypothetical protein EGP82_02690 [Odoribacter splanchnicus]|nr:hypothetical protein [Odoribacter splanchnicus]
MDSKSKLWMTKIPTYNVSAKLRGNYGCNDFEKEYGNGREAVRPVTGNIKSGARSIVVLW